MADGASRLVSLAVLGGPFDGRHVDLASVDEITIGSDSGCSLVLDLPGISPIHAKISTDLDGARVRDTHSAGGVYLNGERVQGERPLRAGDTICLGPPAEPGSAHLQCRFEPTEGAGGESLPLELMVAPDSPGDGAFAAGADLGDAPVALSPSAFDDFAASPAPPPGAPPTSAAPSDFVVAGFDAQWPDTSVAVPAEPASVEDDPFFIGEPVDAPPPPRVPPAPPPSAQDDAFFLADEPASASPPLVDAGDDAPPARAEDFFFGDEPVAIPAVFPPPVPAADQPAFDARPEAVPVAPPEPPSPAPPPPSVAKPSPPAEPAAPKPAIAAAPAPGPSIKAATPAATPATARPPATGSQARPVRRPDAPAGARRPEAGPAARRPSSAARPTSRPAPRRRSAGTPVARYAGFAVVGLLAMGALGVLALRFLGGGAQLDGIEPPRARAGQTVTITGRGFASDAKGNEVLFGEKPGFVLSASATRLEVVVPDAAGAGEETKVSVRVKVGRASSRTLDFSVMGGPAIHGISPDVALPGDEVVLAGTGWGAGASVRFGSVAAQVVEVRETSIRVRVPEIPGGPGTAAPAVVLLGNVASNEMPFFVGTIPLVLKVEPQTASPGEIVTITGRGFQRDRTRNAVLIGGVFALVASAFDSELKAVVPVLPPGDPGRVLEVRVAGLTNVGQAALSVPPQPESLELRFVAQPFDAVAGRDHAVLATELGPAFVLAGSGGRTSADRAVEAQRRLNDAMSAVKATRGLNFEVRSLETSPALGLAGRPELLLEVTEEDARAYDEDWTGLRGRGGPVSRARLARWWEAVARDLVLLMVRGEKPEFAANLAPEGRIFGDVFQAAQKAGRFGVAREVVTGLRPPQREALRIVGLRVPASVTAPAGAAPPVTAVAGEKTGPAATTTPAAGGPALKLDGAWIGSETEGDERRYLTATFGSGTGTVAYEGIVTLTVPLLTLEPQKTAVRFSLQFKGGIRYYAGKWDGRVLSGRISRDPAGADGIGTFELRPR